MDNIDYEISKIDANNLRIKIEEKQMTVSKADETIQQLINDKWLTENEVLYAPIDIIERAVLNGGV